MNLELVVSSDSPEMADSLGAASPSVRYARPTNKENVLSLSTAHVEGLDSESKARDQPGKNG